MGQRLTWDDWKEVNREGELKFINRVGDPIGNPSSDNLK